MLTTGHYLFAAALGIRLISLGRLAASPWLLPSGGDMHFYDAWAQRIARGEGAEFHAFYGLPGYPYFLAFVYKLCGYGPFVPAFLQAVIDAGTAVLIFQLGRLVAADRGNHRMLCFPASQWHAVATQRREIAGAIAGLAWVFFVPAQAYSIILMPTSWAVCAFTAIVWFVVRPRHRPSASVCLLIGIALGLVATAVATIVFLVPLIVAAVLLKPARRRGSAAVAAFSVLLLFAGVIGGTSPCWIHNYFFARDPVLLSAHSGINFWIGNNPDSNGYPRFPPGLRAGQAAMLQDSIDTAEAVAGRPLQRAEVSKFWLDQAKRYITQHPVAWLQLEGTKLRNLVSAFQYDDLSIVTALRERGVLLPGIYFGLVMALALPGMILTWRSVVSRWVLAATLLQAAALLPVFVTERYRLPVVPALLVFATAGLAELWEACLFGRARTVSLYFAILTGSTLFVSWPQRSASLWALDAYNTGRQALESNDLPTAERKLLLARAYVPDNAETNFALGNLRLAQRNADAAKALYRRVLSIDPKHEGALNNLGVIALEEHNLFEARRDFQSALTQNARNAKTHFLLAKTALAAGDHNLAERELSAALKIWPNQREFLALQEELRATAAP